MEENFDSWEENLFAKSHSIKKRKRNVLQNLEFREENENFFFEILTIENISRNEHSILQLEIEKKDHFLSRSRISSMPGVVAYVYKIKDNVTRELTKEVKDVVGEQKFQSQPLWDSSNIY